MRITIITATFNCENTIAYALDSVKNQTYKDIEHIIIDGKSTDNTLNIVKSYSHISKVISETDKGIYYALNKGIANANGDIIGFLHADDFFSNNSIIEKIADAFINKNIDVLYGDLQYVASDDTSKIIRNWRSSDFKISLLKKGWMPPHPTLFASKKLYENFGNFNTNYTISADYDLMLRFLTKDINTLYLAEIITKMRLGGISNRNINTIIRKSTEDYKIIKKNKIGSFFTLLNKNTSKLSQFIKK